MEGRRFVFNVLCPVGHTSLQLDLCTGAVRQKRIKLDFEGETTARKSDRSSNATVSVRQT